MTLRPVLMFYIFRIVNCRLCASWSTRT